MKLIIRKLVPDDDRTQFRSGNIDLDRFFVRYAGQNQFRHHIGTTYLAVDENKFIAGFATVAASEIAPALISEKAAKNLPKYPLPVLRLARLAVDERANGRGVGSELLRAVFALAHQMAGEFGCVGVVVDAKPDSVAFYKKLGLVALDVAAGDLGDRPQPTAMFLALAQIPAIK